jgi:hypothetical protein
MSVHNQLRDPRYDHLRKPKPLNPPAEPKPEATPSVQSTQASMDVVSTPQALGVNFQAQKDQSDDKDTRKGDIKKPKKWPLFVAAGVVFFVIVIGVQEENSTTASDQQNTATATQSVSSLPLQPLRLTPQQPMVENAQTQIENAADQIAQSEYVPDSNQVDVNSDQTVATNQQPINQAVTEQPSVSTVTLSTPLPAKTQRQIEDEATARVAEENARKMSQGLQVTPRNFDAPSAPVYRTSPTSDDEATARVAEENARRMAEAMQQLNQNLERSAR